MLIIFALLPSRIAAALNRHHLATGPIEFKVISIFFLFLFSLPIPDRLERLDCASSQQEQYHVDFASVISLPQCLTSCRTGRLRVGFTHTLELSVLMVRANSLFLKVYCTVSITLASFVPRRIHLSPLYIDFRSVVITVVFLKLVSLCKYSPIQSSKHSLTHFCSQIVHVHQISSNTTLSIRVHIYRPSTSISDPLL